MDATPAQTTPAAAPPDHKRRRVFGAIAAVVALAGVGAALWWWFDGRWYASNDDAYVRGNLVQLTPQIAGIVVRINSDETSLVRAGEPVVELDRADTETSLAHAKAELAQTVRRVRQLFANADSMRANVVLRQAELERAREDLARRTGLPDPGAVSDEERRHAQAEFATAVAALQVARQQLAASDSLIARTTIPDHPDVAQASAQLRTAYLAAHRTTLVAPVSGYVAKRTVQVGQQIAAGAPLLSIVPLDQVWVDANFKETDLEHVRIGQPVMLTADLYGGDVTYRGRVAGLAPGTGSAFALLPPQNATGNWIKIVQRLPVRIQLDARELAANPLRIGLSMDVEIDTHDRSGRTLSVVPLTQPVAATTVYDGTLAAADLLAGEIVAANLAPPDERDPRRLARRE
ncbi:MAG: efflux RND transporter periplasmic adaptor subunit [Pseudomonadota bacterium]